MPIDLDRPRPTTLTEYLKRFKPSPTRQEVSDFLRQQAASLCLRHPEVLGEAVLPAQLCLEEDAGMDSLDSLMLLIAIEERFGVQLTEDFDEAIRMRDLYELLGAT